MKSISAT